jgi:F-type H+-transporting ATPase subunit epsilon
MADQLNLSVLTPDGAKYEGSINGVVMPGVLGSFEVRKNHAPIVSTLEIGVVRVKTDNEEIKMAISGGTAEVNANKVVLVVESAEKVDEIDRERAENAKERALKHLSDTEKDKQRARRALARAENRLKLLIAQR